MVTIKDRIKELRKEKNLTQEELAKLLGLNAKSSIANYESGANSPSDEIKKKMCELFNCSMDYLMGQTYFDDKNFEAISVNEDLIIKQLILDNYKTIKSFKLTYEDIQILSNMLKITTKEEYTITLKNCNKILDNFSKEKRNEIVDFFNDLFRQKLDRLCSNTTLSSKFYMAPVYGKISAGFPNWAEECLEGYLPVDPNLMGIINPEECFFLRVDGESMNKVIRNGAYALIRKQDTAEDGDIVAAIVNGDNKATLKKFKRFNEQFVSFEPVSSDDSFKPINVDLQTTNVIILGRYIGKFEMN